MGYLCEKCGEEFEGHAEYKQHKVNHQLGVGDEQPTAPEQEKPKKEVPKIQEDERKPIVLTYLYTGQCEKCGRHVDTLEMDVGTDHFALAYCVPCKEKKTQRKVLKL